MPIPPQNVPQPHPVSIQPGVVLHPDNVTSAQLAMHAAHSPISPPHHPHHSHPQMHHTAIAPAPPLDATAAAMQVQLHHHLNANAKRTHMALQDGAPDDDPDAAVAARAAAVHAAASAAPGDAQFAQNFANIMGQQATSLPTSDPNRVDDMANEAQRLAQSEAARRMNEQLEAQRQWREEKRREIATKKAKGSASKRGRKKARTSAPVHPLSSDVAMQPVSSHPGAHQTMAAMHMGVSPAYMRDATAQAAAAANVQPGHIPEDHASTIYDGVHTVQNVEQMLQQSVDDGGNFEQRSSSHVTGFVKPRPPKAPAIANPKFFHPLVREFTVLAPTSTPASSFVRPITASAIAQAKHDATTVVTTELLAASTEAALNAVPDATSQPQDLKDSAKEDTTANEQPGKVTEEPTAQQKSDGKGAGATGSGTVAADTIAAIKMSTAEESAVSKDGATEGPQQSSTNDAVLSGLTTKPATAAESAENATEGGNEAKESTAEVKRDASTVGGEAVTEDTAAQSARNAETQQTADAPGEAEGRKESAKERFETDNVIGTHHEGGVISDKEMVNLGHVGQSSADGNQIQVSQDHEGEMKDDPQDGLDVDGGDGGEDIMTAAAWQSLDSISHT